MSAPATFPTSLVSLSLLDNAGMARPRFQNPKIQIRQAKNGPVYFIRYRTDVLTLVDGKPRTTRVEHAPTLGPVTMGLRAAGRAKAELLKPINRQVTVIQSHVPFEQFVTVYKANHLPLLSDTTQKTYLQWLRKYIVPAFEGRKLCDIRPLDVQAFLMALPVAPNTRASIRGVLASIWKQAHRWGYWPDESPVDDAQLGPRKPARRRIIWTPEQIRLILAAVRDDVGLICETLALTGMRISECLGLKPSAFHLDRGEVEILERHSRGSTQGTKSEKGTRILPLGYLTERYAARLRGLPADAWVFPDPRHPERPYRDCELLANYLTPILKRLGLKQPGTGWHTFRRSLASWMNDAGASVFDVRDQLGHADVSTTGVYVQTAHRRGEIIRGIQAMFLGDILRTSSGGKAVTH